MSFREAAMLQIHGCFTHGDQFAVDFVSEIR